MSIPIGYEEQVETLMGLYKMYGLTLDEDSARHWLACNSFRLIESYLNDVGVLFTLNNVSINISVTTVNNDSEWIPQKLRMIRDHFKLGDRYVKKINNTRSTNKP